MLAVLLWLCPPESASVSPAFAFARLFSEAGRWEALQGSPGAWSTAAPVLTLSISSPDYSPPVSARSSSAPWRPQMARPCESRERVVVEVA